MAIKLAIAQRTTSTNAVSTLYQRRPTSTRISTSSSWGQHARTTSMPRQRCINTALDADLKQLPIARMALGRSLASLWTDSGRSLVWLRPAPLAAAPPSAPRLRLGSSRCDLAAFESFRLSGDLYYRVNDQQEQAAGTSSYWLFPYHP